MTAFTQTAHTLARVLLTCHDCGSTHHLLRRDVLGIARWKREHAAACAVRRGRAGAA